MGALNGSSCTPFSFDWLISPAGGLVFPLSIPPTSDPFFYRPLAPIATSDFFFFRARQPFILLSSLCRAVAAGTSRGRKVTFQRWENSPRLSRPWDFCACRVFAPFYPNFLILSRSRPPGCCRGWSFPRSDRLGVFSPVFPSPRHFWEGCCSHPCDLC